MTFVNVRIGSATGSARLLSARAPEVTSAIEAMLPLSVGLVQEQWSGAFLTSVEPVFPSGTRLDDAPEAYQASGALYLDLESGALAVCYGQGRLQNALGPLRAVPVAEFIGGTTQLVEACRSTQFDGVTPMRIEPMQPGMSVLEDDEPVGTRIRMVLGGAQADAILLDGDRPGICASFAERLPLSGVATNTHSSGPLIRFWNSIGGSEGETPLEPSQDEMRFAQSVLYPNYLYYLPKLGFRGLRLPFREPTVMRNAVSAGTLQLIAIAKICGDWSPLRDEASRARFHGALPMEFRRP